MDDLKKKFGKRLQELRKSRNMTQLRLADIIGTESKYISRIESGASSPSFFMIQKLIAALDVETESLFKFPFSDREDDIIEDINKQLNKANYHQLKLFYKIIKDILD